MLVFALIFLIIFLAITLAKIEYGLLLAIALLPAYMVRFSLLNVPTTLLELMIYAVFAVWFFKHSGLWRVVRRQGDFKDWLRRKGAGRYPFDAEIILLLAISFFAVAVTGFSDSAFGIWKAYFFDPILLYIVAINYLAGNFGRKTGCEPAHKELPEQGPGIADRKVQNIFFALSLSALYISIFSIYQKITGNFIPEGIWREEATRRVVSIFEYPNAVGLYLGPLVMIFIGWLPFKFNEMKSRIQDPKSKIRNRSTISRIISIAYPISVIILSALSVYFAKSEGALIGIMAGLAFFGIFSGKKIRWITVGAAALCCAIIISSAPLRTYAVNKITLNDFSGQIRKLQWAETWKMLKDGRLVAGSGLANYQESIRPYHQEGFFYNKDNDPDFRRKIVIFDERYKSQYWQPLEIYLYPHNIFLNFWTELGLAGALLFAWIIIKFFYTGIKAWKDLKNINSLEIQNMKLEIKMPAIRDKFIISGLICSMVVIIVHGFVDVPYFKNDLAAMFWIFAAAIGSFGAYNKIAGKA